MKRFRINLIRSPDVIRHQGQDLPRALRDDGHPMRDDGHKGQAADDNKATPAVRRRSGQMETEHANNGDPLHASDSFSNAEQTALAEDLNAQLAAQGIHQLQDLLSQVSDAVFELQQQHRSTLNEMQQVAVELSVSAASWLTGVAIDAGQFAVDDLIRLALHRLEADLPVRVHLNPADHELLKSLLPEGDTSEQLQRMNCVNDPALPRGGCSVESGRRILVSDMESRLEEIRLQWMENLDATQIERRGDGSHGVTLRRFPDRRETA